MLAGDITYVDNGGLLTKEISCGIVTAYHDGGFHVLVGSASKLTSPVNSGDIATDNSVLLGDPGTDLRVEGMHRTDT